MKVNGKEIVLNENKTISDLLLKKYIFLQKVFNLLNTYVIV